MVRRSLPLIAALAMLSPASAAAFCGFYVASGDSPLFNNATMVVMLRTGTLTVLSMQNDYQGPPEDFALVVPVPVVLHEENVVTLDREVFERVDRLAAPRLVEYWEQDPCTGTGYGSGTGSHYGGDAGGLRGRAAAVPAVTIEAQFSVAEYDVVVLGAEDSGALDTWLRAHDYRIPEGAEPVLRPYVAANMKFFVARVDPDRVTFEDGRALLSPLRFHYESEEFALPVRLGLLNSRGAQDLIVHILAANQRYEVANYDNVIIPTNLDVTDSVRERFGEFYAALFDSTIQEHPGAVVTEYAWGATGCDPCPGPTLAPHDLRALGSDLQPGSSGAAPRIRVQAPEVGPSYSREIVRRVVRQHINEVRFCYERGLNRRPDLAGTVLSRFVIGADGAVTASSIESSSLGDSQVEGCVADAVRRWRFPRPQGGGVIQVTYPFALNPGGVGGYSHFVLTRLHYRYSRDHLGEDLVFRAADPIVGGREEPGEDGELSRGASPADVNTFQARYVIRHPWEGEITCDNPNRGRWGGPPDGDEEPTPTPAQDLAFAPRGRVQLASMLTRPLSELGLVEPRAAPPVAEAEAEEPPPTTAIGPPEIPVPPRGRACGCRAPGLGGPVGSGWMLALVLLALRRRRSAAQQP